MRRAQNSYVEGVVEAVYQQRQEDELKIAINTIMACLSTLLDKGYCQEELFLMSFSSNSIPRNMQSPLLEFCLHPSAIHNLSKKPPIQFAK